VLTAGTDLPKAPDKDGAVEASEDAAGAAGDCGTGLRYLCRVVRNLDTLRVSFDQLTMQLLLSPLFGESSEDGGGCDVTLGRAPTHLELGVHDHGASAQAMEEKCVMAQLVAERSVRRALRQARRELGELIVVSATIAQLTTPPRAQLTNTPRAQLANTPRAQLANTPRPTDSTTPPN
jgi:hypothetical protein